MHPGFYRLSLTLDEPNSDEGLDITHSLNWPGILKLLACSGGQKCRDTMVGCNGICVLREHMRNEAKDLYTQVFVPERVGRSAWSRSYRAA